MRANSLALRLFLSATAWAVVILLITGVVLSSLYRQAVERSFDRRLGVYLRTLVADVASPEEAGDKFPQSLGEPLFELPLSGWYWQVTRLDPGKPDVRSSRSLWDGGLPHLQDMGVRASARRLARRLRRRPGGPAAAARRAQHRSRRRRPLPRGRCRRRRRDHAGDAPFDQALIITFAILAAVLLLTTMFQVRFGLAPLKRITDSLAAIRSGTAERLTGQFPEEIAPLARETNALIDANKEIVERARTHVGNLAHALKTPLSVMVNEAAAHGHDPFADKVLEQADIMRDQVARHLERARLAARHTVVGSVTDVADVVNALARTMEKIHRDRGIAIEVQADGEARFLGERARPRGDDRQPGGQCLQVGVVAGGDRGAARAAGCGERDRQSCASSSTTTAAGCRRRSASRSPSAGAGSTRPSRARGSASPSSSNWPRSTAASSSSAAAPTGGLRAELTCLRLDRRCRAPVLPYSSVWVSSLAKRIFHRGSTWLQTTQNGCCLF